jgi:hypothetical protein
MANDPQGLSGGRFERICQGLPAIEVDCSTWEADLPEEAWSHGQFDKAVRSMPTTTVDCASWEAAPPVWLELVVVFSDQTKPTQVMEQAKRLIGLAAAVVPDLGLTYAPGLSRTEGEAVVIALVPQPSTGAEQRLVAVVGVIGERLTASNAATSRTAVRLARAA